MLEDSISVLLTDIDFFISYIEYLEFQKDSLQSLYEEEKLNIKTVTKVQTKTIIQIDTIRITQSGYDVDKIYSIPFDITERLDGGIYNITGVSKFKWDFTSNKPISPTTTVTSFEMRLNVRTDLLELREGYEVFTQPLTPNVIITENQNNILTENDYIQKIPSKFGIGVIAGYGFTYKGLSPYAGIGIAYNFYDMKKLIQKIRR
jgi:opacity protein-like surface antigen